MKILQIMFLLLMISHKVKTNRLVENTTCLELAKPSNQQLRLTCSQNDYHCLLDETFTKEFEVCREWKWIPGGKCAYFNSYGNGNVDERECKPGINLICSRSNRQFESYKNTQFTACYMKKTIVTSISTTTRTSFQVTSNWTTNGDDETPSTFEIRTVLPIAFGIIVPFLSVSLICSICMRLKATKKGQIRDEETENTTCSDPVKSDNGEENEEKSEEIFHECNEGLTSDNTHKEQKWDERKPPPPKNTEFHEVDENFPKGRESSFKDRNGENAELEPLLINKAEGSIENQQTMRHENEDDTDKGKSAESSLGSGSHPGKSDNEEENEEESTDVFDDTVESLQRITPPTDTQLRTELYNLLGTEGLNLTQEVMVATIIKNTGKSVKTLLNSLTDEEKNKLKELLPEESHRILESQTEHDTSFHVSYGLHQIILDEKKSPKSGWGNPVRGKDIGIGDDVERLHRIQNIVQEISNQETVSVESYTRLLDIMIEALTRLSRETNSEDIKEAVKKFKNVKNQKMTQNILKNIRESLNIPWIKSKLGYKNEAN